MYGILLAYSIDEFTLFRVFTDNICDILRMEDERLVVKEDLHALFRHTFQGDRLSFGSTSGPVFTGSFGFCRSRDASLGLGEPVLQASKPPTLLSDARNTPFRLSLRALIFSA